MHKNSNAIVSLAVIIIVINKIIYMEKIKIIQKNNGWLIIFMKSKIAKVVKKNNDENNNNYFDIGKVCEI